MLISNPSSFATKAKKFAVEAVVIVSLAGINAAIGYAGMGIYSHAVNSDELVKVDFANRQQFLVDFPGLSKREFKVAKHGEYQNPIGSFSEYTSLAFEDIRSIGDASIRGFAAMADAGTVYSGSDICIISTNQQARGERFYHDEDALIVYDKNLFDLFVQSHEAQHCFFGIQTDGKYPEDGTIQYEYLSSIKEVASDLAGILDYMRLTGDDDIVKNLVKPFRLSHPTDIGHTTAAALEVILKDINPKSVMAASANEIPTLVTGLMMKHFYVDKLGYETFRKNIDKQEYPAIAALESEIIARIKLSKGKHDDPAVAAYRSEIKSAIIDQFEAYEEFLPDSMHAKIIESQNKLFERYELHDLDSDSHEPRTARISEILSSKGMLAQFTSESTISP